MPPSLIGLRRSASESLKVVDFLFIVFMGILLYGLSRFFFLIFPCQISARFLKPDKKTADLVGNEKLKASANVRHLVLPCSRAARPQLIPDIVRCYSQYVAFVETSFILLFFTVLD